MSSSSSDAILRVGRGRGKEERREVSSSDAVLSVGRGRGREERREVSSSADAVLSVGEKKKARES